MGLSGPARGSVCVHALQPDAFVVTSSYFDLGVRSGERPLCSEAAGGASREPAAVEAPGLSRMCVLVAGLEDFTPQRPARLATWLLPMV